MRSVAILLLSVAVVVASDVTNTAALGDLDPESLLARIGLSDEMIAKFQPKNVNKTNDKLRKFVQGAIALKEACKDTKKSTLCQNTLKKPFSDIKKTYSSLFEKYQGFIDNATDKQKEQVASEVNKAKDLLEKLKGNSVISLFEGLMNKKTTKAPAASGTTTTKASSGSGSGSGSSGSSGSGSSEAISKITDLLGSFLGGGSSGGSGIDFGAILGGLGGSGSSGGNPLGGLLSMFG